MEEPSMSPLILVVAGLVCGTALLQWILRQVRLNDDLERVRAARMSEARLQRMPGLRRDPTTGAYWPE